MNQRRSFSKLTMLLICMALLLSNLPASLMASGLDTVRVGFFAFDGYHEQDADGVRSGYGYDILQHMAGYAGFRYDYVGYDKNWGEMQEMLANGEIDLLTSAQKTPERERRFDFSANSIGVSSAILTVSANDTRFFLNDYAHWNGIRVGMIEGNSRNDSFAEYAAAHGFSYATIYFSDMDAMVAELQTDPASRSIDAVLTSNLRRITNEIILAQFDASPFYIMVQKGNDALLQQIDNAIAQMDNNEPGLRTDLMNAYYAQSSGDKIAFTPEEQSFIRSMQGTPLTALLNPDRKPYSWMENGEWNGILADAAQEMIRRSGLDITLLTVQDRNEYESILSEGTAVIRFDAEYNTNQAEAEGYWLTAPYLTVPLAKVYRKGTANFFMAAIPRNSDAIALFARTLEDAGIIVTDYESVEKVVKAVKSGKQDAAFLAMDSANRAVRDDVTNKLRADECFGDKLSYSVAVNQNQDARLFSILNKAVSSLNGRDIDHIRQNYATNPEKPFSLTQFFYDYPLYVVFAVVVILCTIMLIIVTTGLMQQRKAQKEYLRKEQAQNAVLKDALHAAENAGVAKSQFLSRVSHEMRTPLNAIIGFLTLAKDAPPEQMETYRANSELAAKQLISVINDVLDMSSIESGKLQLAETPFDFRRMIYSITNLFVSQCREKGIAFETKLQTPTEEWLVGDQLRLNQILINLLSNAVKFTSTGYVHLLIRQMREQDNLVFLRFEVADTGCGMSEEMQKRLFTPFEQEDADTARKYGGSGLGLSIVKNLVNMMEGAIVVTSKQGTGSTFTVDLPFKKGTAHQDLPELSGVDKLRVLAVDDDAIEREYISIVLRRIGVDFTCVEDGEQALLQLEQTIGSSNPYNICLVDWKMPHMDGAETTNKIRAKYGDDLIVIVVSAYDHEHADVKARQAGANLFVPKPLFQSSLFDLFMTLTGGRLTRQTPAPAHYDFTGKRILLVEDNEMNQIVAQAILARLGASYESAADGQIAYDRLMETEAGYFDVILMDVQMPNVDGLEATRMIRASSHPDAQTIPIIALTANAFNEDVAKTVSAGMNAHVSKPIEIKELTEALDHAFRQRSMGDKLE